MWLLEHFHVANDSNGWKNNAARTRFVTTNHVHPTPHARSPPRGPGFGAWMVADEGAQCKHVGIACACVSHLPLHCHFAGVLPCFDCAIQIPTRGMGEMRRVSLVRDAEM